MDKEKELPKRKHPRLDNYDYSSAGAYFVTICTQNRRCVLSRIVGRGLAPAETTAIEYTSLGEIAEEQLFLLAKGSICQEQLNQCGCKSLFSAEPTPENQV